MCVEVVVVASKGASLSLRTRSSSSSRLLASYSGGRGGGDALGRPIDASPPAYLQRLRSPSPVAVARVRAHACAEGFVTSVIQPASPHARPTDVRALSRDFINIVVCVCVTSYTPPHVSARPYGGGTCSPLSISLDVDSDAAII